MISLLFRCLLFLVTVFISTSFTPSDYKGVTPQEVTDMSGRYTGGWTSTTPGNQYDSIPISAILSKTDQKGLYSGEFFFTGVHYSCCKSGKNDGLLSIQIEGSVITNYDYSDILPKCHGYFSGKGIVDSLGTLMIQFNGYDCEGKHKDSSLFLTKQSE